jgi:hypothetical protein
VAAAHEGILLITDKGFAGRDFEQLLAGYSITLLRPSRKDEQAQCRLEHHDRWRDQLQSVSPARDGFSYDL